MRFHHNDHSIFILVKALTWIFFFIHLHSYITEIFYFVLLASFNYFTSRKTWGSLLIDQIQKSTIICIYSLDIVRTSNKFKVTWLQLYLRHSPSVYKRNPRESNLLWPDTLSIALDGYVYVTANQLHSQVRYQKGQDLRRKPYTLFRVHIDTCL
jgi:hypothetical protein